MRQKLQVDYDKASRVSIKYDGLRDKNLYTIVLSDVKIGRIDVENIEMVIKVLEPLGVFNKTNIDMLEEFGKKMKNSLSVCMIEIFLLDVRMYKFYYKYDLEFRTIETDTLNKLLVIILKLDI